MLFCPTYLCLLQKFGGMGDDAMGDDIDESDDEGS